MQKIIRQTELNRSSSVQLLSFGAMIGRFLWLALVVVAAPICLFIDVKALGNAVTEASMVEATQLLFLAASIMCFVFLAHRKTEDRSFALLAAAFFACLMIREMDQYFDVVFHGFWKYVATPIALASILYALNAKQQTWLALSRFMRSQAGLLMLVGMVILLFYSRLMGMSGLWKELLDTGYARAVKNAVEESAELLGYSLIFAASIRYMLHRLRVRKSSLMG